MVNGQTIRPKKNLGGRNGRLKGADEVRCISSMIDRYDAETRAGAYAPSESWHEFKDHSGLLGDMLRMPVLGVQNRLEHLQRIHFLGA